MLQDLAVLDLLKVRFGPMQQQVLALTGLEIRVEE
jgi:hypothetical protein